MTGKLHMTWLNSCATFYFTVALMIMMVCFHQMMSCRDVLNPYGATRTCKQQFE